MKSTSARTSCRSISTSRTDAILLPQPHGVFDELLRTLQPLTGVIRNAARTCALENGDKTAPLSIY
jgi:hypothetical protein